MATRTKLDDAWASLHAPGGPDGDAIDRWIAAVARASNARGARPMELLDRLHAEVVAGAISFGANTAAGHEGDEAATWPWTRTADIEWLLEAGQLTAAHRVAVTRGPYALADVDAVVDYADLLRFWGVTDPDPAELFDRWPDLPARVALAVLGDAHLGDASALVAAIAARPNPAPIFAAVDDDVDDVAGILGVVADSPELLDRYGRHIAVPVWKRDPRADRAAAWAAGDDPARLRMLTAMWGSFAGSLGELARALDLMAPDEPSPDR